MKEQTMEKTLVLGFSGTKAQFESYLEFLDDYLEYHPGVTMGEVASDEVEI
jgi:hypothetical protein